MSDNPDARVYTLSVQWPPEQPKPQVANQFAISLGVPTGDGPDAVYLMIGHVDPPFVVGPPDDVAGQVASLGAVTVDVLGRYVFTRSRLDELIRLLQNAADAYDQAAGGEPDAGATR